MRYPTRRTGSRPVPGVRLEPSNALTSRSIRAPQHSFRLKVRPWQIVPAGIAPVLPGDTVKAASMKMRVLSKPIQDRLSGWWLETFLFYVRLGDLSDAVQGEFKAMILAGTALPAGSNQTQFYNSASKWPIVRHCYDKCVWAYFRNEDSWLNPALIGDYEVCKVAGPGGLFDSVAVAEEMDGDTPDDADDWVKRWEAFQGMRQEKITTATWEEYLAAQGVALPPQLQQNLIDRRPELLHFTRDWQFPVNAIEPSTGVPSALVQWMLADRLKRGRFCAEPGYLIQLVVCRPKALLKNQRGTGTSFLMDRREAWMPSALEEDPHARLRMFEGVGTVGGAGSGPVYGATEDYWVDPQDLLSRGDQFTNYDLGSTVSGAFAGMNYVNLPVMGSTEGDPPVVNTLYPSEADADRCFAGADKWIEIDGVTTYQIASRAGRGDVTGKRKGMA